MSSKVVLTKKWEKYLTRLAQDYKVTPSDVVNQLCEWAFADAESKEQFRDWLNDTYPSEEKAEEAAEEAGTEAAEEEEEYETEAEEESDEHREY